MERRPKVGAEPIVLLAGWAVGFGTNLTTANPDEWWAPPRVLGPVRTVGRAGAVDRSSRPQWWDSFRREGRGAPDSGSTDGADPFSTDAPG